MPIDLMTSNLHPDGEALIRQSESTRQSLPLGSASAFFFIKNDDAFSAQVGSINGTSIGAVDQNALRPHHILVKCLKPDHGEAICTSETRRRVLRWRTLDQDRSFKIRPSGNHAEKLQRDIGETQ